MNKKIDNTFITHKHIISELEQLYNNKILQDDKIIEWAKKWWAEDKKSDEKYFEDYIYEDNSNLYKIIDDDDDNF